jgi:hypothetical protein
MHRVRSLDRCSLAGGPVMIVNGLMMSDAPSFTGNWFNDLCAPSTMALIITFGTRRKGRPCMVHLMRSLTVRIDRSTSCTWSSASAMFTSCGSTSFTMQLNYRSASSRVMLKPRAVYMLMMACVSSSRVRFDRSFIGATVPNLIHWEMVWKKRFPLT